MNRKISDKDKKDWDEFISSEDHLPDKDLDLNKGYKAAERCGLSIVAHVRNACGGDLEKVKSCVKLTGYVNSTDDFKDQPKIINGASDIIAKIFDKKGEHTRAAVSVNSLPLGVAVEVDAIFELN